MWLYLFLELKVGRVEREYEKWGKKICRYGIEDMGKKVIFQKLKKEKKKYWVVRRSGSSYKKWEAIFNYGQNKIEWSKLYWKGLTLIYYNSVTTCSCCGDDCGCVKMWHKSVANKLCHK